jgi:hypothetical protein
MFTNLAQRFTSRLPNHPHGYILRVQAPSATRNQALPMGARYFLATLSNTFSGSIEGIALRREVISRGCFYKPFSRSRSFCINGASPKTARVSTMLPAS